VLLSFADAIDADAGHLTELEVTETGKPWTTMLDGEIPFASDNVRFFAGAARSTDGSRRRRLQRGLHLGNRAPPGSGDFRMRQRRELRGGFH